MIHSFVSYCVDIFDIFASLISVIYHTCIFASKQNSHFNFDDVLVINASLLLNYHELLRLISLLL